MASRADTTAPTSIKEIVAGLMRRARAAQKLFARSTQEQLDEAVTAVGWAIMSPPHNKALAELAVKDTGLGVIADIMRRITARARLLRNEGSEIPGVIAEHPSGNPKRAPRGIVARWCHSTNPAATPPQHRQRVKWKCVILRPHRRETAHPPCLLERARGLTRMGRRTELVQQLRLRHARGYDE